MKNTTALLLVTAMAASMHFVESRAKSKGVFLNKDAFLSRNIDNTTKILESAMKVDCTNERIDVSFRLQRIIGLGVVQPTQLSLAASECKATVNQSHFILQTLFENCDTNIIYTNNNMFATVKNKVIITGPMSSLSDDEDAAARNLPVEIPIKCSLGTSPPGSEGNSRELEIDRATINLYNTDSYVIEVDTERGVLRGTSLYAKVTAWNSGNREQNFVLDSCYWSCKDEVHYLIKSGCPVDRDVQFKEDSREAPRKFLLRARIICGSRPMRLHCTLAACSRSQSHECETQEEYCSKEVKDETKRIVDASISGSLTVAKRPSNIPRTKVKSNWKPAPTTTKQTSLQDVQSDTASNQLRSCPPIESDFKCICKVPADSQPSGMVSPNMTILTAVLSFVIGAAFIALIWCIYTKTETRKTIQSVSMSDDGLSSQDSAAPTEKLMKRRAEVTSSDESA